jgi:hypothetical protein
MQTFNIRLILLAVLVVFSWTAAFASAQTGNKPPTDQAQGGDDLRAKVQNPVSSMYSLPLKLTVDFGAPDGSAYFFNINPVIPVTVGDWNLISRALIPAVVSVDGLIAGTPEIPEGVPSRDRKTGLGDINYSLFVSPNKTKPFIWGLGPSINLPTASKDQLGSGKWSAGPTGVILFQPKWGTYGGLVRQLWSFAGDDDRSSVSQMLIEPFINYNLGRRLVPDLRYDSHGQLERVFRSALDRSAGRWGRKAFQDRQPADQLAARGLLQHRHTGCRAGLAGGVHVSVFVPQMKSPNVDFMKRDCVA